MKLRYFGIIIICLLFISCINEKKNNTNKNGQNKFGENVQSDSKNETIYGDGYCQHEENGLKLHEISDADEFRSKLSFYKFYIDIFKTDKDKQAGEFKFDVSIGSVIYTTIEYLIENSILNEALACSIIDVLTGYIPDNNYFSQIDVFFTDIYYGNFLFYHEINSDNVYIRYSKAEGISIYFEKGFTIDNNNHVLSSKGYDVNNIKKMEYLCKLYNCIIANDDVENIEDLFTVLGIDKEEFDLYKNEFQAQSDYNYLNDLLFMKIKELFNYNDEVSSMVQHIIIKYNKQT